MMRTYVFGAGASLHAGYPLAKQMGHKLFQWMDEQEDVGPFSFRQTTQFLRDFFHQTEDIEILITSIEEMIASHPVMGQRPPEVVLLCNCHKPTLIAAIRMWFEEIRKGEANDYARFARDVAALGDCVLTFNYDVSLEPHLMSQKMATGRWLRIRNGGVRESIANEDTETPRECELAISGRVEWPTMD
jgi:hypothetical protein